MKTNRGLAVVAALAVGSAALVGCNKASEDTATKDAPTESVASADGANSAADEGTTQDARFGFRGGRGFRGHAGFRHGGRGWGGRGHRAWWRFW